MIKQIPANDAHAGIKDILMGARIVNDGFSDTYLYYAVGVNGFPNTEFSMTWRVKAATHLNDYQTYACVASTTFSGGNEYWTAADFNTPSVTHIGSDGSGSLLLTQGSPSPGVWKRMAFQRLDAGGGTIEQRWWPDLDKGQSLFIQRNDTDGIVYEAAARFCIGSVPYTTHEGVDGTFADVKVWSIPKTIADLDQESTSGQIVLSNGGTSLWAQYPLVSDGNDISGNARHLTSEVSGGSITFDGLPGPGFAVISKMNKSKFPRIRLRVA